MNWLLDIAKYMATAILLTSIFSDMQNMDLCHSRNNSSGNTFAGLMAHKR